MPATAAVAMPMMTDQRIQVAEPAVTASGLDNPNAIELTAFPYATRLTAESSALRSRGRRRFQ